MVKIRDYIAFAAVLAVFLMGPDAFAKPAVQEGEQFNAVHHSADANYLDFNPLGVVELPRIFLVRRDGSLGLDVFGSTAAALQSGAYRVAEVSHGGGHGGESEAAGPAEGHEAAGSPPSEYAQLIRAGEHLEAEIAPAGGALLLDLSITRHLFFAVLGAFIVALLFIGLARRYRRGVGRKTAPKGVFQNIMETMIVFIRDEVAKPTLGDHYHRFLPYLLSVFFFILTLNVLGLVPFGATATSNITITAVLAIFTFFVTQFNGSRDHWKHIFWPPGVPVPIKLIMIPIEIIGQFTKPFALAVRLFANMTAGHLVILSLIGLIFSFTNILGQAAGAGVSVFSVVFALFIYLLELLVVLIQAYIFTILSGLFIGMAIEEHDVHEGEAQMDEGDTPDLHGEDHGQVTPHPLSSEGDGVEKRTQVETPKPVATG